MQYQASPNVQVKNRLSPRAVAAANDAANGTSFIMSRDAIKNDGRALKTKKSSTIEN